MNDGELLTAAFAAARRYIEQPTDRVGPTIDELTALAELGAVTLDEPIGAAAAVALLDRVGSPATMRTTGGRYFGFVNGGVAAEGLAASILASAWDQNAALAVMSPVSVAVDEVASTWLVDVLGLPSGSTAAFCAGATIANITAIVTARDALLEQQGWDIHDLGLAGSPPLHVITSAEAHVSVQKALRIAGIGQAAVTRVPTDAVGALRADALPELDGPTLVLLQAGNVNTGHSDPFAAVIDRYGADERDDVWVHVDGAFGLWANAVPERRRHVEGVDRADSWATDGHKWLNSPYDCGVVICADGRRLQRSMRMEAAYVPTGAEERAPMNLGLQMSQAARAVPVWAVLAARGRAGVAEAIEQCCRCAERFAERLGAAGVDVLAAPVINQVLVSFGDDETTDAVVSAVQSDGTCWMGPTTWQGRRAMRISVSSFETTFDDVDESVDAVLRCRDEAQV